MSVSDLLERPTYGMAQVDAILGLHGGTARRWIDGYSRASVTYPPVVRVEHTGEETVTWGEFVETRLLAEFRDRGVPMVHMRPTVVRLRAELKTAYPLAHASPYLDADGRELVRHIQAEVSVEGPLRLVIELARTGQLVLSAPADQFARSAVFSDQGTREVVRLHPFPDDKEVVIDPLRRFGEPVVRSVPTEVIAEQFRRGDPIEMLAELFELTSAQVQAAIRYEGVRRVSSASSAA
jgi:uncharacterized protein (DUF433 family)